MSLHSWYTTTGSRNTNWDQSIEKNKIWDFKSWFIVCVWIELFPSSRIHTLTAMTEANGAEQEREDPDHCSPVFHGETQIASKSAVTCTQWGLCTWEKTARCHEHHSSSLLSREKHRHESDLTTSVHTRCTHIGADECCIWKTLVWLLTVIHHRDVSSGSIYVDITGAVGVQDAGERHFVIRFLWCQTWTAKHVRTGE